MNYSLLNVLLYVLNKKTSKLISFCLICKKLTSSITVTIFLSSYTYKCVDTK
jgi:hypothetical protein